jgi:NitT/TauT family transport system permease protein
MRERATQVASIVALVLVWSWVAMMVGTHIIPTPSQIVPVAWNLLESGQFVDPLLRSLARVALGFGLGFALGVAYGIVAGRSPMFSYVSSVLFNVFLFAPTLVVIFLGVIMFGANDLTAVMITGFLIFPAVGVSLRSVAGALDRDVLEMADAYKVRSIDRVRGIYVPYLIPPMLAAARTGFSGAWKIVLLTEVFGLSGGLGYEIRQSYFIYNLPLLVAWLSIFIAVLLLLEQVLRSTERSFVRWQ